jgi:DNA-binding NarL/FixJ family response regulator
MNNVRILVVDDHPFFRKGVVAWLEQQPGFQVCGQAGSLAEARHAIAQFAPAVLLLDLHLRDGEGLDLLPELADKHPELRTIVLSQCDEDAFAHRALRAGARAYVMKSEATEVLLLAIHAALRGDVFVSRSVSARLLDNLFPDLAAKNPNLARLSDREIQVFQLLGSGSSNREIAVTLSISIKTVETHREHLKEKLLLPDAEQLIRAARHWVRSGEFKPGHAPPTPS